MKTYNVLALASVATATVYIDEWNKKSTGGWFINYMNDAVTKCKPHEQRPWERDDTLPLDKRSYYDDCKKMQSDFLEEKDKAFIFKDTTLPGVNTAAGPAQGFYIMRRNGTCSLGLKPLKEWGPENWGVPGLVSPIQILFTDIALVLERAMGLSAGGYIAGQGWDECYYRYNREDHFYGYHWKIYHDENAEL